VGSGPKRLPPPGFPARFLERMPKDEADRIVAEARRRRFRRGEVVFHEGDTGDALHVIVGGRFAIRVSTPEGEIATLAILGPGEIFGELALLDADDARTATMVATEAAETLSLSRAHFERLRERYPSVAEFLLSVLAEKLRRYTRLLVEALYVGAERRVLKRVTELADVYATVRDDLVIPLTQTDIGGLAGTSRATVNRVLRQEQERGTLVLDRGRITILDLDRLRRRADPTAPQAG
jgi:CRP/FNR family transcriptional regulator, cyclic AMP receptor protein